MARGAGCAPITAKTKWENGTPTGAQWVQSYFEFEFMLIFKRFCIDQTAIGCYDFVRIVGKAKFIHAFICFCLSQFSLHELLLSKAHSRKV